MKKFTCALIFCLAFALTLSLFAGCGGGGRGGSYGDSSYEEPEEPEELGLEYTLNDDGESYSVTGIGEWSEPELVIPAEHRSLPVTEIGSSAFKGSKLITSVSIPSSIKLVGNKAFNDCKNLQYNEYENGSYLGNEDNPYMVFVKVNDSSLTTFTLNDQTKFIYNDAFRNYKFTELTLPEGILQIGNYAFSGCSELTSLVIPEGVTYIGESAFEKCTKLENLSIPNSVTTVKGNVFTDCNALQYTECDNAYYLGNSDNPYVILIKAINDTIISCNVHEGAKVIYFKAFYECFSLKTVSFPEGLVSIGSYAFYSLHSMANVTFPASVKAIGDYAFYNSWALKKIVILNGSAQLGFKSFQECGLISEVYFKGTQEQWNKAYDKATSPSLNNGTIYLYSETEPVEVGNYWHFNESGEISLVW